jgi:hypothetical protein
MARHEYREENLIPGAEGPAVQRYKAVIALTQELNDRGFLRHLTTVTFVNPGGKDGRYRDLLGALAVDYWRKKGKRLRYICNVAPSTFGDRLWAAHLLWQHDLPDLGWIARWLMPRTGRTEDEIAKHVIWEGDPAFSAKIARWAWRDRLAWLKHTRGRIAGFGHEFGQIDLRFSDDTLGDPERVPSTEYFAQHSMTDETFTFESAFTRGREWKPRVQKVQ